ncbi:hypothetical protein OOZ19_29315 [Saccharopolyspora sp. NFXS83]|uniref:hypothetical protein n=1 Tax=Saccharopolyspora sp. NFXS83 TaxID=2993560 RepID=UPI00224AD36A|nr:hypothetical protein [Saccharopolyspora sp. NFXS83]MCX2734364.1 hypothetical protein [Saccharopolyspora sp. NFXS83]
MTWNDFYQRQHAIRAVLDHAREHPAAPLNLELVPAAEAAFTDRGELLRALQHKWSNSLTGRIDIGIEDADSDPRGDRVEAVSAAWRRATADNPVLRRVLDSHADDPAIIGLLRQERRMLAVSAGLAEPHEPAAELDRVGAAFLGLLRTAAPSTRTRRRGPLSQLRRVIPSR